MKEKIWNKDFFFAWMAMFFISIIMYMLNSTIAEYANMFTTITVLSGMVTGIYTFGGLITRLWSGGALQSFGWKRLAVIMSFIQVIACALYFFANDIASLLIIRFVHGLAFGATASGIVTIASSSIPKSRQGEGMGIFMLAATLAIGVGPYVGGFIIDGAGTGFAGFGATGGFVMAIVCALGVFLFLCLVKCPADPGPRKDRGEEDVAQEEKPVGIRRIIEPSAVPISVCMFLYAFSYAGVSTYIRLYAAEYSLTWFVSYFFVINALVLLIVQPLAGKIQDKTGSDNVPQIIGILAQAIGVFMLFIYPSVLSVVLSAIGTAMGYGCLKSQCQAIAVRNISQSRRSYAVSTFWVFTDIGMTIGPILLGFAVTSGQYASVFLWAAVVAIVALPVYWLVWGRGKGKHHTNE